MGVVLRAKNATVNTKVLVHFFFLRSLAQEPQTCETFEERTNIQCCPFKKDHDSRDSRPPKMTHAKSIKS